ncbi:hypothetical protein FKG94_25830 [Exilibacterium tricleocarpae]|uniref:Uncharacterized protein n=1 Tax=Exilibacterium tricleocarpae TaxID=2591008 RepID=A0A545SQW1_9GAMM|nr:hypothetical protein FKG94_25830 [Exilibacterium tricleocarpae]
MRVLLVKLSLLFSILVVFICSDAVARSIVSPSSFSKQDRVFIDQLRLCVKVAIRQGLTTSEEVSNHCRKEVDVLENAVTELPGIIISNALNIVVPD